MITTKEIRQKYLDYFKKRGHTIIPSSSLVPENDPTTLFTGSGMQPMIPYLLGESHAEGTRLVDSQKCFRTVDIDVVGDNRHTTFFEMLGNWSLGDYFKKEQIEWIFEFLTKDIGLDPNRLYVSVFRGNSELKLEKDEESANIWKEVFSGVGIDAMVADMSEMNGMKSDERIFYYDDKKNWWSRAGIPKNMPAGEPGGPDSEMFWDFGSDLLLHENSEFKDKPCHINCDCGRFFEIGNSVFMKYKKTKDSFVELEKRNIDFGGGLERIATAVNCIPDIFLLDVFDESRKKIEELSGLKYDESDEIKKSYRVILDHLRASVMLIGDGVVPTNTDQGYFTRRLIRRSTRHGRLLGLNDNFCKDVASSFIKQYGEYYIDIEKNKEKILNEINLEEKKFRKTLEKGLKEFEKMADDKHISSKEAFILFSTYGFPLELTEELAVERNFTIDKKEFEKEFEKHQNLSRQGGGQKFKGGLADDGEMSKKYHTATHLLHVALKKVLGDHVQQKGSNINGERMRFDFSHGEKMTDEQKKEVEKIVNTAIEEDYHISCEEMSVEEAKKMGAIGLFEDRYGSKVKVYTMGDFSKEICGGPHVERTGVLGQFKIKKEESSSSGIRRIKAILQ